MGCVRGNWILGAGGGGVLLAVLGGGGTFFINYVNLCEQFYDKYVSHTSFGNNKNLKMNLNFL